MRIRGKKQSAFHRKPKAYKYETMRSNQHPISHLRMSTLWKKFSLNQVSERCLNTSPPMKFKNVFDIELQSDPLIRLEE